MQDAEDQYRTTYEDRSSAAELRYVAINTLNLKRTTIKGAIRWDHGGNPHRIPGEIGLYLLADGMEEIRQTFHPADGPVAIFEGVPSYINGRALSYTVLETGAAGFDVTYSTTATSTAERCFQSFREWKEGIHDGRQHGRQREGRGSQGPYRHVCH